MAINNQESDNNDNESERITSLSVPTLDDREVGDKNMSAQEEARWRLDYIKEKLNLIVVLQTAYSHLNSKEEPKRSISEIFSSISNGGTDSEEEYIDPYLQLEFEDSYICRYFEGLIGLEINHQQQKQEYLKDKKAENTDDDDPVIKAMEYQYQEAKTALLKYLQKESGSASSDKAIGSTKYSGSIIDPINELREMDTKVYEILAQYTVEKCSSDSHLITLFKHFKPAINPNGEVLWLEKVIRYATKNIEPEEISPFTQKAIDEWRTHLLTIYSDFGLKEIPPLFAIPHSQYERWMIFLDINPNKNLFEELFNPKKQGGSYMPCKYYGPHKVPLGFSFVFNGPKNSQGYTSELIYEEMTHSISDSFPRESEEIGKFWPNKRDGAGDFLEEGYVGAEMYLFIQKYHPEFFDNPKLPLLQIKNHLEGKDVKEVTNNIYPTIFVLELIRRSGEENLLEIMRGARANRLEFINILRSKVNILLGDDHIFGTDTNDEFLRLCKLGLKQYDNEVIYNYIRRLEKMPITSELALPE